MTRRNTESAATGPDNAQGEALKALFCLGLGNSFDQTGFTRYLKNAGLNPDDAQDLWTTLLKAGFLKGQPWRPVRDGLAQSMAGFTDKAWRFVLPRLKSADVDKLPADWGEGDWSQKNRNAFCREFLVNTARFNSGKKHRVEKNTTPFWGDYFVQAFCDDLCKKASAWILEGDPVFTGALKGLPYRVQQQLHNEVIEKTSDDFLPLEQLRKFAAYFKENSALDDYDRGLFDATAKFQEFLVKGHPEDFLGQISEDYAEYYFLNALIAVKDGQNARALKTLREGLSIQSSEKFFWRGHENWLYGTVLWLNRNTPSGRRSIEAFLKSLKKNNQDYAAPAELMCRLALAEDCSGKGPKLADSTWKSPLSQLMVRMICFNFRLITPEETPLTDAQKRILEAAPVLNLQMRAATGAAPEELAQEIKRLGFTPLMFQVKKTAPWENALTRILEKTNRLFAADTDEKKKSARTERIAYLLDRETLEFTPCLQVSKDGVTWKAGRHITLTAYVKGLPQMTEQDQKAARDVIVRSSGRGSSRYELKGPRVAADLIGHPAVFDKNNPEVRISITEEPLQVKVTRTKEGLLVRPNVNVSEFDADRLRVIDGKTNVVHRQNDGSVSVVRLDAEAQELVGDIGKLPEIPVSGEKQLKPLLTELARHIPVESDLVKAEESRAVTDGDSRISLLITPVVSRFVIRAAVVPLEGSSVTCEPGRGLTYIAAVREGVTVQVRRDLQKERQHFKELEPVLTPLDGVRTDTFVWETDAEGCLTLLEAVRTHTGIVTVRWPQGEKFKLVRPALGLQDLSLTVTKKGQWFEVEGDMRVDAQTRLKIALLLMKLREATGRFIALSDNEYIALTDELRRRLSALEQSAAADQNRIVLSVFQMQQIRDLAKEGARITKDKGCEALMRQMEKAADTTFSVPAGLTAELRDYQVEGYEWLMRLASWGAGALLSDDMGLGKTVQTIAALLTRAKEGPQLVVVPTSVLLNWRDELTRFAPGLTQVIFNLTENRGEALKHLKAGTVVLTTYGVMTGEIETLAAQNWTTVVFDEAHTVKNRDTKAFKAAVTLKADFRILLTGTPLQNHLSEIWALFDIAVPGLLGTFNRFTERFVLPIERDKDRESQRLLKRLISPFILRRTKTDVLTELPEKTEVTVKVTLSPEEKALYEEIREETAENLKTGEINPVQALAALTKLRQAACAPQLVNPELGIKSSKTEAFLKLADDLISNGHRALVFSQFTSHLALIRKALDAKGITYRYLDGAMTPTERIKTVQAFSNGDEPLILISLRAGGTGLNLTAADYVIHLDPWWNPAVEDQASDRAYRIGQERPVTIYRLIAEGTVEEKILRLHSTKKSLADALLEGTDMSQRLGRKEILELLELAK